MKPNKLCDSCHKEEAAKTFTRVVTLHGVPQEEIRVYVCGQCTDDKAAVGAFLAVALTPAYIAGTDR